MVGDWLATWTDGDLTGAIFLSLAVLLAAGLVWLKWFFTPRGGIDESRWSWGRWTLILLVLFVIPGLVFIFGWVQPDQPICLDPTFAAMDFCLEANP
jgi:hypothetical protein